MTIYFAAMTGPCRGLVIWVSRAMLDGVAEQHHQLKPGPNCLVALIWPPSIDSSAMAMES